MATKLTSTFFTAGNATFTVKVPTEFAKANGTNLHYTFKIRKSEPTRQYPNPAHFVKLLTGPDNTRDYSYLGILNPTTGEVRLSPKSCAQDGAWSVKIVRRVLAQIFKGEGMQAILNAGWDVHHEGRCGRCGRPLTVPESIECGIGPDCADQMGIPYPTRTATKKGRSLEVNDVAREEMEAEADAEELAESRAVGRDEAGSWK